MALGCCGAITGSALLVGHPLAMLAAGMVPLAMIIALRMPFLLCLMFVLLTFFRLHEAFPVLNPLRLPQLVALGTLAVLAAHLVAKRVVIAWNKSLRLFAIFFALITVGALAATGRDIAIAYWTDTFVKIGIMTFAIASLARAPADFALATRSFVLAGILVSYVALYNSANGIGLVEGTRVTIGRDTGSVLGDPNDLSLVLLFPMSFAAALLLTPRMGILSRLYGLAGFATMTVAVLATQSRGGLLGIVAVCATFAARKIRSRAVLIAGGILGLLALSVVAGISGRSSGGAAEGGAIDESAEGRLYAWQAAIRMAFARPLTGVGLNNYVANYYYYSDWWEGFAKAVHSTWFSVMAEGGLLAFGVFMAMIVVIVRSSLASVRQSSLQVLGRGFDPEVHGMAQAVLAGIAGFIVSGTFLTQGFTWPVYILLALSVATERRIACDGTQSPDHQPTAEVTGPTREANPHQGLQAERNRSKFDGRNHPGPANRAGSLHRFRAGAGSGPVAAAIQPGPDKAHEA